MLTEIELRQQTAGQQVQMLKDNIKTRELAQRSMLSRLITSLVNEKLTDAFIVNIEDVPNSIKELNSKYLQFVHFTEPNLNSTTTEGFYFGVENLPIYSEEMNGGMKVNFMDTEDVTFPVHLYTNDCNTIQTLQGPELVMEYVKNWNQLDTKIVDAIVLELLSCVEHQDHAFRKRKSHPTFENSALDWEQSIVEGHPTHPMNKARHAVAPIQPIDPSHDLLTPNIHFFVVPRSEVTILGKFESLIQPLFKGMQLDYNPETEVLFPVHELQIPNIEQKFKFARKLDIHFESRAQCALRTVILNKIPELAFKLAVGIKVTSALRTITPWTTYAGPFMKPVADRVVEDKQKLVIVDEMASLQINHPDTDIAKHMSCVLREDTDKICPGENVIVCAALTERNPDGSYVLKTLLNLDTETKRVEFFQHYAKLYLECFMTPVYKYGYTFEAHLQNVMARFKKNDQGEYKLVGFAVRDFGGVKCDQAKLFQTTGMKVKVFNEDAYQSADGSKDMHHVAFHTMIQMHLHRIIRALNLHYNGKGWAIVRNYLEEMLPQNSDTRQFFLETDYADWKCFVTMKLKGIYRHLVYQQIPNLIRYQPPSLPGSPNSNHNFLSR